MKCNRQRAAGFSLTDLTVTTAAIGMLLVLGAPALRKGQSGVDVRRCQDNLRRLSMAQLMFANVNGGLPPMALARNNAQQEQLHPDNPNIPGDDDSPGAWYNGHGWYSLVGPFIGEPAWAAQISFAASMTSVVNAPVRRGGLRLKLHACPADIGLQRNEWASDNWAHVLSNYVVNAGNTNYGQSNFSSVAFLGAPFMRGAITPLPTISDGLSRTLLMSENVVLRECSGGWGGAFGLTQVAIGGQMFTAFNRPNPGAPDGIGYGRNGNGDCGSIA